MRVQQKHLKSSIFYTDESRAASRANSRLMNSKSTELETFEDESATRGRIAAVRRRSADSSASLVELQLAAALTDATEDVRKKLTCKERSRIHMNGSTPLRGRGVSSWSWGSPPEAWEFEGSAQDLSCSQDCTSELLSQFGGHSSHCSHHHRDQFGFHLPLHGENKQFALLL